MNKTNSRKENTKKIFGRLIKFTLSCGCNKMLESKANKKNQGR